MDVFFLFWFLFGNFGGRRSIRKDALIRVIVTIGGFSFVGERIGILIKYLNN